MVWAIQETPAEQRQRQQRRELMEQRRQWRELMEQRSVKLQVTAQPVKLQQQRGEWWSGCNVHEAVVLVCGVIPLSLGS